MHKSIGLGIVTAAMGVLLAGCETSVGVGVAPICPYGYFETAPYGCAPDGYYGPEWFSGGVFIGAGPWYHGSRNFYGHVDHGFDYRQSYHGPYPARNDRPVPQPQRVPFHGSAMHDPRGHEAPRGRR